MRELCSEQSQEPAIENMYKIATGYQWKLTQSDLFALLASATAPVALLAHPTLCSATSSVTWLLGSFHILPYDAKFSQY